MGRPPLLALTAALFLGSLVPAFAQGRGQAALPDGPGKEAVQKTCTACHGLTNITGSGGFTRQGWEELLNSMLVMPKDQQATIVDYLAKNFPEGPHPQAVIVQGPASVSIKEWVVPTLGSRPHDPLAAPDGSIWWSGMFANVIGHLDPKSGAMKEYPLKTPQSGPHGLVFDKAGKIWFTANSKTYIGTLDPKTGEVTEHPLNNPDARGPHTPRFDQNGTLWFTLQSSMVGRLNTATGEMKIVSTPSPNSYPYGMVINSKGVPFYADFRGNRIGRVDPQTMAIHEFVLPDPEARPRRITVTPDDVLWYTDFARGYLGRLDPKTGNVREWKSPGGGDSQPYGITAIGDVLWYSESGVRPNTLVRFDTRTEKFQTWVIPSGGGVVRNMMATADGNLVLACSGRNRVALVEIKKDSSRSQ